MWIWKQDQVFDLTWAICTGKIPLQKWLMQAEGMIKWVRPCKRIRLSRLCTGGAAILGRLAGGFAEPFFVGHGFQFVLTCYWLKSPVNLSVLAVQNEFVISVLLQWVLLPFAAWVAVTVALFPADSAESQRNKTLFVSSQGSSWVPRDHKGYS